MKNGKLATKRLLRLNSPKQKAPSATDAPTASLTCGLTHGSTGPPAVIGRRLPVLVRSWHDGGRNQRGDADEERTKGHSAGVI